MVLEAYVIVEDVVYSWYTWREAILIRAHSHDSSQTIPCYLALRSVSP